MLSRFSCPDFNPEVYTQFDRIINILNFTSYNGMLLNLDALLEIWKPFRDDIHIQSLQPKPNTLSVYCTTASQNMSSRKKVLILWIMSII